MPHPSLAGATQDEVRRHNLGSLLRLVHFKGAVSRSELAARTGLNRSTIGGLTADLAAVGLVREDEPVGRGVGRPSIVVAPVAESAYVVAVDIGVAHATVSLVGLGGGVMSSKALRHVPNEKVNKLVARVATAAQRLSAELPDSSVCVGAGVGVPGVVHHGDGVVEVAPNRGWFGVPLGDMLSSALGGSIGVAIANDADLAAVAEHARGSGVGFSDLVIVNGDVGVGGGIVINGALSSGARGYGGEIGHMVVNPTGKQCRCGAVGCWETTIGTEAVADVLGLSSDDDVVAALATAPIPDPRLSGVGRWLGLGIQNIVNILNPEVVILGGLAGQVYPHVVDAVAQESARSLEAPRRDVEVRVASLGSDAVTVGAAEMAFAALLRDPLGHVSRARESCVA